ncbi:unnamed protein product [Psylliodes chrysocephalus]|uniref:Uncharacterized protein n=1 Tax=Psylliodes chrysocephalus TaxID=3402493 RepID=A0A9P0CQ59_9CUCU|nr:unnamed protein product [Psylliodes chrysocephala]
MKNSGVGHNKPSLSLKGNISRNWENWIVNFKIYLRASGLEDENENRKVRNFPPVQRAAIPSPEKWNSKSRWRSVNVESRKNIKRKRKRDLGLSYINKKGNEIENRILGSPCRCKKNCRQKLQGKEEEIFHSFWNMGNYDLQNAYLFSSIKSTYPKRRYRKKTKKEVSGRKCTILYHIKVNGEDITVCKAGFFAVYGL